MIILVNPTNTNESVVTRTNPNTGITATKLISASADTLIKWFESDVHSDVQNPDVPPAQLEFLCMGVPFGETSVIRG